MNNTIIVVTLFTLNKFKNIGTYLNKKVTVYNTI